MGKKELMRRLVVHTSYWLAPGSLNAVQLHVVKGTPLETTRTVSAYSSKRLLGAGVGLEVGFVGVGNGLPASVVVSSTVAGNSESRIDCIDDAIASASGLLSSVMSNGHCSTCPLAKGASVIVDARLKSVAWHLTTVEHVVTQVDGVAVQSVRQEDAVCVVHPDLELPLSGRLGFGLFGSLGSGKSRGPPPLEPQPIMQGPLQNSWHSPPQ